MAFWVVVVLTAAVTYIASATQKYGEVTARVQDLDQARDLGDPQLIELATRVAFVLAGVISGVVLALFLSLCSVVDSRVVPGLRRSVPGLGLIGPAVTLGFFSTFPVALGALVFAVNSPKNHPVTIAYLVVAAAVVAWVFLRGHWSRLTPRRRALALVILGTVAALSLVV